MAQLCLQSRDAFDTRNQHLSLGVAFRPDQDGLAAPLRDPFRQPPIYNGNASRWERTRLYYRRLFELIESFYLESPIEGDNSRDPPRRLPARFRSEEEDPFSPDFTKLKITPGRNLGTSLGLQAIPFYYPLTDGAARCSTIGLSSYQTRVYDQHLSYHASDGYDSYNDQMIGTLLAFVL
ncbi:hypothetical protein D5R40_33195 [Okeania hirsuta]|uniref:Uncharacterized protein n=1 Tax=Okeania hirsuta TaxID=1458930 RepID=A0A3N6NYG4_9CYAN|nr:hypothetical protein D5R40_33195 [Okeania hirsuta]